jgi:hypothetical protein
VQRAVHIRTAAHEGRIYLDMADDRWRAVEIGPDGWQAKIGLQNFADNIRRLVTRPEERSGHKTSDTDHRHGSTLSQPMLRQNFMMRKSRQYTCRDRFNRIETSL